MQKDQFLRSDGLIVFEIRSLHAFPHTQLKTAVNSCDPKPKAPLFASFHQFLESVACIRFKTLVGPDPPNFRSSNYDHTIL